MDLAIFFDHLLTVGKLGKDSQEFMASLKTGISHFLRHVSENFTEEFYHFQNMVGVITLQAH